MKKLCFIFSVYIFLASCHNSKNGETLKSTDLVQQNLKGKVQHIEVTSYTIDSAGNSAMDSTINIIDFDEKGYATRYINKSLSGKLTMDETVTHYNNGAAKEFLNRIGGKQISKL